MSHSCRGVGNRPFVPQPNCRGSPQQTMVKSPLLKITLIPAQGLGLGSRKPMGGSWSLLTDRSIPWWSCGQGTEPRSAVSPVLRPATLRVENGSLPVTISRATGVKLWPWGTGKSLGRELEIQTVLGDERSGENPFHPCLPSRHLS